MDELTSLKLETLLDQVADRAPTPGGGTVAATAAALACALARMAAAYSVNGRTSPETRRTIEDAAAKLRRLDQLLRALITQDATAYAAMTAAGKRAKEDPSSQAAYREAVLNALSVPMETAALASQALAIMDETKEATNPHLLSDLGVAAILAEAAARASHYMVLVNAAEVENAEVRDRLLTESETILRHSGDRTKGVQSFVERHLKAGLASGR